VEVFLRVMENTAGPPAADLAREELLLREAGADPVLFFYSWPDPALVLGHGQGDEGLDLEFARARNIAVVRRATGGTGVYHHNDLAVSLALPATHPWAGGIRPLYDRMTEVLAQALGEMGIVTARPEAPPVPGARRPSLCFADHTVETLLVEGCKSVGCSQARRQGAVLVHAFLLFNDELSVTARLFRMEPGAVSALIAPLPLTPESRPLLRSAVVGRFSAALGLEPVAVPLA
jgi:lipoate-protein ligase A